MLLNLGCTSARGTTANSCSGNVSPSNGSDCQSEKQELIVKVYQTEPGL